MKRLSGSSIKDDAQNLVGIVVGINIACEKGLTIFTVRP